MTDTERLTKLKEILIAERKSYFTSLHYYDETTNNAEMASKYARKIADSTSIIEMLLDDDFLNKMHDIWFKE